MRLAKYTLLAALLAAASTAGAKEKRMPTVYMYGFSASFTDSTVYFTNVQAIDSVWMDTKTDFLLGRENYSLQLKNMLANERGEKNRTCIVVYGTNKTKVEKDLVKLRKKYTVKAKGHYDVRYIADTEFRFKPVDMSYEESDPEKEAPAAKEAAPEASEKGQRPAPPRGPRM